VKTPSSNAGMPSNTHFRIASFVWGRRWASAV
jgi:hypothetical protein